MELFLQQVVAGAASGAIYASLALALVLIYRSTEFVNFAQGEMAMFSTYIAWSLINSGMSYWLALPLTLALSFLGGLLIERIVIRPVEGKPEITMVIVSIGLLLLLNALAGFVWSFLIKEFPSPFPRRAVDLAGVRVGWGTLGTIAIVAAVVGVVYLLFQRTRLGLQMRAVASNRDSAALAGIRVGWMLALGWGLAALVGAVSGILVAPVVFLEPNMMAGVLIFAFAAATLGGLDSPLGAIVGGLVVGISENLAGTYIDVIGTDLKIVVPLVLIVVVLLLRPQGLFGHQVAARV